MLFSKNESTAVRSRRALAREGKLLHTVIGPPRSMARRVARVAILSAALGGLAAAALAVFAVDRALTEQADVRLRGATDTLAGELDEDDKRFSTAAIRTTLDDENEEIVTSGIRLAVYAGERLVAGDRAIPRPADATCDTRGHLPGRVHACARPYHQLTLVAAQPSDGLRLLGLYALSCLIAVALGAVVGGASSTALTRWAVKPLEELTGALERLQPDAAPELGPPSPSDDVESIRRALLELLERVNELIGQARRFAGDAAHELRTPLATLRAEIELLAEGETGAARAALDRVSARTEKLSALVDRLLVLALPAQNLATGFENVALSDVVTDAVDALAPESRARVRTELEVEGMIRGDERLLASLVTNALENGLKFSTDTVVVRVRESEPNELRLEVSDQGPGVAPELRDRVFEPFFRAAPSGKRGHGLGLALIGHIARVHGGVAAFADAPAGARLVVTLPAWDGGAP
jgi:two-component system, OmpR family, sensor kinase